MFVRLELIPVIIERHQVHGLGRVLRPRDHRSKVSLAASFNMSNTCHHSDLNAYVLILHFRCVASSCEILFSPGLSG